MSRQFLLRLLVFTLASTSFMCLLGEFYAVWSMRLFACAILLPAMVVLFLMAVIRMDALVEVRRLIIEGTVGGLLAAVAYDLYRVPFVMAGYPLFKVFDEFGKMLVGKDAPNWLIQLLGWAYHFSNGAALGIMFLCMVPRATKKTFVIAGAVWALMVEGILLLTPYRDFFKIRMDFNTFLVLTATAHLIFGLVLGWWSARRTAPQPAQLV